MAVVSGDNVKIHYTGKFEDGEVFDSSVKRDQPFIFQTGAGMVIPGFDEAVIGMDVGETKSVTIPPEKAYGEVEEHNIIEVSKSEFPEDMNVELGLVVELHSNQGHVIPAEIVEIQEEGVKLNANHPLAGKTLIFEIELLEIGCELPQHNHHNCGSGEGCDDHEGGCCGNC